MENYGTPEKPYWKAKGGSDYRVTAETAQAAEAVVQEKKCHKTDYSEEYIIGSTIPYEQFVQECRNHPWMIEGVETVA